jgi:4-carboxymuconolactone decarboxylase
MTQDFAKLFQSMMEQGQTMARAFTPSAFGTIDPKAFEAMFPAMPKDMLEMFFGKTFNPEGLDARTRFLVTIAAQTVLGPLGEPQLRPTVRNALAAGATAREIAEVIWQMSMFGGLPATQKALEIAQAVFTETEETPA